MKTRNALVFAALSAALLGSGVAHAADVNAADVDNAARDTFAAQLDDAKDALIANDTAMIGREERNEARKYLTMAESLWNNGSTAKAQQFLDFARGRIGLTLRTGDVAVATRVNQQASSAR